MSLSPFFAPENPSRNPIETLNNFLDLFKNIYRGEREHNGRPNIWRMVTDRETNVTRPQVVVGVKITDYFFYDRLKRLRLDAARGTGLKTNNSTDSNALDDSYLYSMQFLYIPEANISAVLEECTEIINELTSSRAYLAYLKKGLENFSSSSNKKLPAHIEQILGRLINPENYETETQAWQMLQEISTTMQDTDTKNLGFMQRMAPLMHGRKDHTQAQYDLIREEIAVVMKNRPQTPSEQKRLS